MKIRILLLSITVFVFCSLTYAQSPCDSTFSASITTTSIVGADVSLVGTATYPISGAYWTFSDGGTAFGWPQVQHTYSQSGWQYACADVYYWDPFTQDSCWTSSCFTFFIAGGSSCDSSAFVSLSGSVISGNTFSFSATGNQFYAGYQWSFGDGNTSSSGLPWTQHTYAIPGTYTACINAWYAGTLNDTCWVSDCFTVTVGTGQLTCDSVNWSVDFVPNVVGNYVQFVDQSNTAGYGATYFWDFGDGQTTVGSSVGHQYQSPGTYGPCLYVSIGINNGADSCFQVHCDTVVISGGSFQCDSTAFVFFVPSSSGNGQVFFNGTGSMGYSGYSWTFGDGNSTVSTSPFITHQYTTSGTYTACLSAWYYLPNGDTCWVDHCDTVAVSLTSAGCDSTAYIDVFGNPVVGGTSVVFSSTGNQNFQGYNWTYGDGNTGPGGPVMTYQYTAPGTYTACVDAWYYSNLNDTCWVSDCFTVTVGTGQLTCDSVNWSVDFVPNVVGNYVQFLDQSNTAGYGATYFWDFGDGQTAVGSSVGHQYQSPGTYGPCLYVSIGINNGADSCFQVHCDTVVISGSSFQCDSTAFVFFVPSSSGNGQVFFNGTGSMGFSGYSWTFGDGNSTVSTSPFITHQYTTSGTYTACLSAWYYLPNGDTCWVDHCDTVVVSVTGSPCDSTVWVNLAANPVGATQYAFNVSGSQFFNGYSWDLGDGTVGTGLPPSFHQYPSAGVYTACVDAWYYTITNDTCWVSDCITINVASPPSCDSTAYVQFNTVPLGGNEVSFTVSGNQFFGGYIWYYGDGNSGSSAFPWHQYQYTSSGNYTACVNAWYLTPTMDTCWVSSCSVINTSPIVTCDSTAFVDILPISINGNLIVLGAQSNQSLIGYFWDFGNGTTMFGSSPITYQYPVGGTYNVCVEAWYLTTMNDTCWVSDCMTTTIGSGGSICDSINWSVDFIHNTAGQTVQFIDQTITGGFGATYFWDFGDGQTSTLTSPSHTYTSPGTYGPCLYVAIGVNGGMDSCFLVHCDTVLITTNGIGELDQNLSQLVFPNPFHDQIQVDLTGVNGLVEAIITDLRGRQVWSGVRTGGQIVVVNTSTLQSGVYLLQVQVGEIRQTTRLIRQ